jgi:hypothetical protein
MMPSSALPQFADDQAHEEILLVRRRPQEQLAQQRGALLGGAFALHGFQLVERAIDFH